MMVQYKDSEGHEMPDAKGNIFVACFTTAHARMKLYSELEKVGDRALYFDTGNSNTVYTKYTYSKYYIF